MKARDLQQMYGWHCPALRTLYSATVLSLNAGTMAPTPERGILCDLCLLPAAFLDISDDVIIAGYCPSHAVAEALVTAGAPAFDG